MADGNTHLAQHLCECADHVNCRICRAGSVGCPNDLILFEGGFNATCRELEIEYLYYSQESCDTVESNGGRERLIELCECVGSVSSSSSRSFSETTIVDEGMPLQAPKLGKRN